MKNPLLKRKRIRKITDFFNSGKGVKYIPYGVGAFFISWFCRTDFAQKEFFKKRVPPVDEFLSTLGKLTERERIIREHLQTHFLHGWRTSKLSRLGRGKFNRIIDIRGWKNFEEPYSRGNGVIILNSHFGYTAIGLYLFTKLGYSNYYSIIGEGGAESMKFAGIKNEFRPNLLVFKRGSSSELFRLLYRAREILQSGGILHMLGDGYHGRSDVSIDFLGKVRGFRSSFAELGLSSGSSIVPVFIYPGEKGKIVVEIYDELDKGDDSMDNPARVKHMVHQYAELLERKWKEKPQFVSGGFIDIHNKQVRVDRD